MILHLVGSLPRPIFKGDKKGGNKKRVAGPSAARPATLLFPIAKSGSGFPARETRGRGASTHV